MLDNDIGAPDETGRKNIRVKSLPLLASHQQDRRGFGIEDFCAREQAG
jgi:hypothetical protein